MGVEGPDYAALTPAPCVDEPRNAEQEDEKMPETNEAGAGNMRLRLLLDDAPAMSVVSFILGMELLLCIYLSLVWDPLSWMILGVGLFIVYVGVLNRSKLLIRTNFVFSCLSLVLAAYTFYYEPSLGMFLIFLLMLNGVMANLSLLAVVRKNRPVYYVRADGEGPLEIV